MTIGRLSVTALASVCAMQIGCGLETWTAGVDVTVLEGAPVAVGDVDFSNILDVRVKANSAWILDSASPFITLIDLADESVRQAGNEGSGPGEFKNPVAIEIVPNTGDLIVWDPGALRATVFSPDATRHREIPLRGSTLSTGRRNLSSVTFADPFRVRLVGDRVVWAEFGHAVIRPADLRDGVLASGGIDLKPDDTLVHLGTRVPNGPYRELGDLPLWDACRNETILSWDPESGLIRRFDSIGALLGEAVVPIETRPKNEDDISRYLRVMARLELGPSYQERGLDFGVEARRRRGWFAEEAPRITELRCGSDGSIWVRLFDTTNSGLGLGREWIRLGEGRRPDRFQFPPGFSPRWLTEDRAIGSYEHPSGRQILGWMPIPEGSNAIDSPTSGGAE